MALDLTSRRRPLDALDKSFAYNAATAERVIAALPDFIDDVRYLLNQLACVQ